MRIKVLTWPSGHSVASLPASPAPVPLFPSILAGRPPLSPGDVPLPHGPLHKRPSSSSPRPAPSPGKCPPNIRFGFRAAFAELMRTSLNRAPASSTLCMSLTLKQAKQGRHSCLPLHVKRLAQRAEEKVTELGQVPPTEGTGGSVHTRLMEKKTISKVHLLGKF